jgi:thiazolylpeptide-type bacteriocin precursor
MNDSKDLATLIDELQALESETFEVRDYTDSADLLLIPDACSTSSTSSTTSSTCA